MKIAISITASVGGLTLFTTTAFAGAPLPAPVAGAMGPVGIGIAAVAYCGYRIIKHRRDR